MSKRYGVAALMLVRAHQRAKAWLGSKLEVPKWLLLLCAVLLSTAMLKVGELRSRPRLRHMALNTLAAGTAKLGFCARNPYLSSWDEGEFGEAARSLVDFKTSLVRVGHGTKWDVAGHERFDASPAVQRVEPITRIAEGGVVTGDGGKWIVAIAAMQPGCVIYSIGSLYNFDFENEMLRATPCEVYTFDCTCDVSDSRFPRDLDKRIHFFPYCLGSGDDPTGKYRSLDSLAREMGHTEVTLLKMDIEGFEYGVIESLYHTYLSAPATGSSGGIVLPFQMLFEMHHNTYADLKWGNNDKRGLSAGEMALSWVQLAEMGYVVAHREDNSMCQHCSEFVVVRALC